MAATGQSDAEVGALSPRALAPGGEVGDGGDRFRVLRASWRCHSIRAAHDAAPGLTRRYLAFGGICVHFTEGFDDADLTQVLLDQSPQMTQSH